MIYACGVPFLGHTHLRIQSDEDILMQYKSSEYGLDIYFLICSVLFPLY